MTITVEQKSNDSRSNSSLLVEGDKLIVVGLLRHGTELKFSTDNAHKLRDWLNKTYDLPLDVELADD